MHWMPLRWPCLDHWTATEYWIHALQWRPLWFFTNNVRIDVLRNIHPLNYSIPPQNWKQQAHNKLLSQQFAYHSHCHWGKCLAKTNFICHQGSCHIWIPNPSPHNEKSYSNLERQKRGCRYAWNRILLPGTWFALNWFIRLAFSRRTASIWLWHLNSLLGDELLSSESGTPTPPSTCTYTSFTPLLVVISSRIVSCRFSGVSWVYSLILQDSWNSSPC